MFDSKVNVLADKLVLTVLQSLIVRESTLIRLNRVASQDRKYSLNCISSSLRGR